MLRVGERGRGRIDGDFRFLTTPPKSDPVRFFMINWAAPR